LVYIVNEIEDGSPCIRRTLEKQGVVGHSHAGWMQGFPIEFANLLDIEKRRSSESLEPITTRVQKWIHRINPIAVRSSD
jgi:hypothetical protein